MSEDNNLGSLEVNFLEDCSIAVSDITEEWVEDPRPEDEKAIEEEEATSSIFGGVDSKIDPPPPPNPPKKYRGWAQSKLHDFIHLSLTSVKTELTYYDTGTKVYYTSNGKASCKVLYRGWRKLGCTQIQRQQGSKQLYSRGAGGFKHCCVQPSRHTQVAKFYGKAGGKHLYSCSRYGRIVGPTHWHCNGGKR